MKQRWMATFYAVLLMILVIAVPDRNAAAKMSTTETPWKDDQTEIYTEGPFTYYIHPSQNEKEAWVYRIEIQGEDGKDLSIPETILGKKVTRLGCLEDASKEDELTDEAPATLFASFIEPWHEWEWDSNGHYIAAGKLKSVRIPDTVEYIDRAAFGGLNSIKTIKLPKKIKTIEEYTFYGCDQLETIILPEQMKSFDNSSLMSCPALKNIKISKKNQKFQVKGNCLIRKKDKALVIAAAQGKKFTIPNGIRTITAYAFRNAKSSTVHIPASVKKIEGMAFCGSYENELVNVRNVTISKKNPVFAQDGQCIYKKSDKSLAVAMPNKKRELRISERVKKLTPDISMLIGNTGEEGLDRVIFPSGLKHVIVPAFGRIRADKVYFTGSVPPKVVNPDPDDNYNMYVILPISHIYVPKASNSTYKKWYKKHKFYENIEGWHTYNPDTGI